MCLGAGFEDLAVGSNSVQMMSDVFQGEAGQSRALERWARRSSSKAGQVSSPAFRAEATTGLHRPGLPWE